MTDRTARCHRRFEAPIERVWAAWTQPDLLALWYCPNPDLPLAVDADVVPGGAFRVVMGGTYVASGRYTSVEPPTLLEFTWAWEHEPDGGESIVRVELAAEASGTELTLIHRDLESEEDAAGHAEGWELSLGRLAEFLAAG